MKMDKEAIPLELRELEQWVVWRYQQRGTGKPTKVPFAVTGEPASSTDPTTWSSFSEAISRAMCKGSGYDGVGFVFAANDGYWGLDLDDCLEAGEVKSWARDILAAVQSYTEISPSGYGLKLIARGSKPSGYKSKSAVEDGAIELYDSARYFTITADVLEGRDKLQAVNPEEICKRYLHRPEPQKHRPIAMVDTTNAFDRCRKYLEKLEPAIEGQHGHDRFFQAACECYRFGLETSDVETLMGCFNDSKCAPPFSSAEVKHKIEQARAKVSSDNAFGSRLELKLPFARTLVSRNAPTPRVDQDALARDAPGLLGVACRWILAGSEYPQPSLALGAAISAFAVLLGRKVQDINSTRTNTYVLALAESSSGKGHPFNSPRKMFENTRESDTIGMSDIGSRQAFLRHLEDKKRILLCLDEADGLFRSIGSEYMARLSEDLKTIYSEAANRNWIGSGYADLTRTVQIDQPHCCIYATANRDPFFSALNDRDIQGGLLGRFLLFVPTGDPYPPPNPDRQRASCPDIIKRATNHWASCTALRGGDSEYVRQTPAAAELLRSFANEMREILRDASQPPQVAPAVGKAQEHSAKLALIAGCAGTNGKCEITEQCAEWAIRVARMSSQNIITALDDYYAASPYEKTYKAIRRRGRSAKKLTRQQIMSSHPMESRKLDQLLISLAEAGDIVATDGENDTFTFSSSPSQLLPSSA